MQKFKFILLPSASIIFSEYTFHKECKKSFRICFCKNPAIRFFFPEVHRIYNSLTTTNSVSCNDCKAIKSIAHGSVNEICHCQWIIDHATNNPLLFPVKIHIKSCDLTNKFSHLRIQAAHIFQPVRCQDNFTRYIQSNHMNLASCLCKKIIHNGSCIRITPVIILSYRRTISMTLETSSHGYHLFYISDQFRLSRKYFC